MKHRVNQPTVEKKIAPKAIHAPHDGECENCELAFDHGDWVLQVSEGDYEYFIHEVCPNGDTHVTERVRGKDMA